MEGMQAARVNNTSRKKSLLKNETFGSQDTKPFCDYLDTLSIISNNYDGRLL